MTEPQTAHGITYEVCEHGTLTFSLIDGAGVVYAVAHVPAFGAETLLEFLVESYCPEDDDVIGEVAGNA